MKKKQFLNFMAITGISFVAGLLVGLRAPKRCKCHKDCRDDAEFAPYKVQPLGDPDEDFTYDEGVDLTHYWEVPREENGSTGE